MSRAGGNPFYIEEPVKYMRDKKVIVLRGQPKKKPHALLLKKKLPMLPLS